MLQMRQQKIASNDSYDEEVRQESVENPQSDEGKNQQTIQVYASKEVASGRNRESALEEDAPSTSTSQQLSLMKIKQRMRNSSREGSNSKANMRY